MTFEPKNTQITRKEPKKSEIAQAAAAHRRAEQQAALDAAHCVPQVSRFSENTFAKVAGSKPCGAQAAKLLPAVKGATATSVRTTSLLPAINDASMRNGTRRNSLPSNPSFSAAGSSQIDLFLIGNATQISGAVNRGSVIAERGNIRRLSTATSQQNVVTTVEKSSTPTPTTTRKVFGHSSGRTPTASSNSSLSGNLNRTPNVAIGRTALPPLNTTSHHPLLSHTSSHSRSPTESEGGRLDTPFVYSSENGAAGNLVPGGCSSASSTFYSTSAGRRFTGDDNNIYSVGGVREEDEEEEEENVVHSGSDSDEETFRSRNVPSTTATKPQSLSRTCDSATNKFSSLMPSLANLNNRHTMTPLNSDDEEESEAELTLSVHSKTEKASAEVVAAPLPKPSPPLDTPVRERTTATPRSKMFSQGRLSRNVDLLLEAPTPFAARPQVQALVAKEEKNSDTPPVIPTRNAASSSEEVAPVAPAIDAERLSQLKKDFPHVSKYRTPCDAPPEIRHFVGKQISSMFASLDPASRISNPPKAVQTVIEEKSTTNESLVDNSLPEQEASPVSCESKELIPQDHHESVAKIPLDSVHMEEDVTQSTVFTSRDALSPSKHLAENSNDEFMCASPGVVIIDESHPPLTAAEVALKLSNELISSIMTNVVPVVVDFSTPSPARHPATQKQQDESHSSLLRPPTPDLLSTIRQSSPSQKSSSHTPDKVFLSPSHSPLFETNKFSNTTAKSSTIATCPEKDSKAFEAMIQRMASLYAPVSTANANKPSSANGSGRLISKGMIVNPVQMDSLSSEKQNMRNILAAAAERRLNSSGESQASLTSTQFHKDEEQTKNQLSSLLKGAMKARKDLNNLWGGGVDDLSSRASSASDEGNGGVDFSGWGVSSSLSSSTQQQDVSLPVPPVKLHEREAQIDCSGVSTEVSATLD
eukprot:GDKK01049617.1.p1 GENE.GDKK01049617.1~~GDKK01049617.1.p1  ORF type:complete len:929 (+),score=276.15 GDKK01049617.1:122-2908(+)